ncbi:unnamed protein product [Rhizophagus irregularis]|nr:unnamed protein product [Rhizophagus irregularis]CAB5345040.1 unnamed protein product [Rhizophagus irregularis]
MILDNGKACGTINYVASERVCRDIKMRDFFDNGEHLYESVDDEDIKEQKRNAHSIYRLLNFTLINKVVHLNLI